MKGQWVNETLLDSILWLISSSPISSLSCSDLSIAIYSLQEFSDICEHETDNHSFRGHDLNWNHERDIRNKGAMRCFVLEMQTFYSFNNSRHRLKAVEIESSHNRCCWFTFTTLFRLLFAVDLKEFHPRINARCGSTYAVNKIITFSHMVISGLSSVWNDDKKYLNRDQYSISL